jgi:hypothetical protein
LINVVGSKQYAVGSRKFVVLLPTVNCLLPTAYCIGSVARTGATNRRLHGRAIRRAIRFARACRALSVAIPVLAYIWR